MSFPGCERQVPGGAAIPQVAFPGPGAAGHRLRGALEPTQDPGAGREQSSPRPRTGSRATASQAPSPPAGRCFPHMFAFRRPPVPTQSSFPSPPPLPRRVPRGPSLLLPSPARALGTQGPASLPPQHPRPRPRAAARTAAGAQGASREQTCPESQKRKVHLRVRGGSRKAFPAQVGSPPHFTRANAETGPRGGL